MTIIIKKNTKTLNRSYRLHKIAQYLREGQVHGYQYSPKVSVPRLEKYAEILEKNYRSAKKEKMIICKI